ncbi:threonine ammonia-lyase [Phycisphaerales bacterium AB-hyl4]|uniref:Threonine ammonia-lyase n=1 Tax=Natronomicrosphaera hydrolytica TaxID=3242702 RepID=A0ABV4U867_9BACT
MQPVTFEDVQAARQRIGDAIVLTPCAKSPALSEIADCELYCKLEYLQRTGSFKERGAANALTLLAEVGGKPGVVAASAGNHALALAYHGKRLGLPVTVVMPRFAPLIKAATCQRLGANVIKFGESFAEARQHADRLTTEQGLIYVHGYDDPAVIAGQGTLGIELHEQLPELDAVVIPIGGGGLIAGVAVALKALRPDVTIIGVEPERMPCYSKALEHGEPCMIDPVPSLADGLAVGRVGERAFLTARPHVDRVVQVSEAELALAILRLLELEKAVVEGAGAASLAAVLAGKLPELAGKRVALPLCGGNIDPLVLRRVIEHGLAVDHRLCRFTVTISDRPGGLAKLTRLIADADASIQEVRHDRIFAGPEVTNVQVDVVIETRDADHAEAVRTALKAEGLLH